MTASQTNNHKQINDPLADELAYRSANPDTTGIRVSVAELKKMLADIGYKMDNSMRATFMSKYMTGERAGKSYPCTTIDIVQIDNRMSYSHFQSRRDANFDKLQAIRNEYYAVSRGTILKP